MTADRFGRCQTCGRSCSYRCEHCDLPVLGPFGGMLLLARSLMAHYEVDFEEHDALMRELADEIGEELLSLGREFLEEHGLIEPA